MNSNDVFSYVKMFLHASVFVHSLFQCLQSHPTEEAVSLENSGMHWFDSFSQMPNCVCVLFIIIIILMFFLCHFLL